MDQDSSRELLERPPDLNDPAEDRRMIMIRCENFTARESRRGRKRLLREPHADSKGRVHGSRRTERRGEGRIHQQRRDYKKGDEPGDIRPHNTVRLYRRSTCDDMGRNAKKTSYRSQKILGPMACINTS